MKFFKFFGAVVLCSALLLGLSYVLLSCNKETVSSDVTEEINTAYVVYEMPEGWEPDDSVSYDLSVQWVLGRTSYAELLPVQYGLVSNFDDLLSVKAINTDFVNYTVDGVDRVCLSFVYNVDNSHWLLWYEDNTVTLYDVTGLSEYVTVGG